MARAKASAASEKRFTICCSGCVWVGKKKAVVSEWQLFDFQLCEETSKVEEQSICPETGVDAV